MANSASNPEEVIRALRYEAREIRSDAARRLLHADELDALADQLEQQGEVRVDDVPQDVELGDDDPQQPPRRR